MSEEKEINTSSVLRSVFSATPQSVAAQAATSIITSPELLRLVRTTIVDPVKKLAVPKIEAFTYSQCREVFLSLFWIFENDQDIANIIGLEAKEVAELRKDLDDNPYIGFYSWMNSASDIPMPIFKMFKYKGAIVCSTISIEITRAYDRINWKLEFLSPTHKAYEEFVKAKDFAAEYIETGFRNKHANRIKVINGKTVKYSSVPATVKIPAVIEDDIEHVIKAVMASDYIKDTYSVNKTTGVLLWGEPGGGKSTLARYLAMKLNRTLVLAGAHDLEDIIDMISSRRGGTDEQYIILIEDIDFKFVDRRRLVQSDSKKKKSKKDDDDEGDEMIGPNNNFSETDTLFQILDGVLGDSNLMVIATTNYKDRLDPALIRDGRFDFDIEVVGLSYDDALDVCRRFDVTPEEINLKSFTVPINPATLQTVIMKYKTMSGGSSVKNEKAADEVEII